MAKVIGESDTALLTFAVGLAVRAGQLALRERVAGLDQVRSKSSPTDIVTAADAAAEDLIREAITSARPDDAIVGEEGQDVSGSSGVRWYVDPIDGTVNYYYGLRQYAVSIGAERDGAVVAAAVFSPATNDLFTAVRGRGAFHNAQRLGGTPVPEMSAALVATGFGYSAQRRGSQAAIAAEVLPRVRDIRRAGAASLDLVAVAAGWVDAYYEQGLQPWDLAAGELIAKEAGAQVTGLSGRPPGPAMVLAARPALHEALDALLSGLDADQM